MTRSCTRCGVDVSPKSRFCPDCIELRRAGQRHPLSPEVVRLAVDMAMGRVPDEEEKKGTS